MTAVGAPNARESVVEIAALDVLLDDITNDRAPESEFRLVPRRVRVLKFIEVSGHKPVKRRLARTAWFV